MTQSTQEPKTNPPFVGEFQSPMMDDGPFACLTERPLDKRTMQEIVILLQVATSHFSDADVGDGWIDRLDKILNHVGRGHLISARRVVHDREESRVMIRKMIDSSAEDSSS